MIEQEVYDSTKTYKPERSFRKARFLVTRDCPYNCTYCHNEGMGKVDNSRYTLEVDDYFYFGSFLKERFGLKVLSISGGDPFVYKPLPELARALKDTGLEMIALSKGMPINRRIMNGDLDPTSFDYVNFAIDTLDPQQYSSVAGIKASALDESVRALDWAVSKGIGVQINCVVPPEPEVEPSSLFEMIDFAKKHGVLVLKFIELLRDDIRAPYLESILEKMGIYSKPEEIDTTKLKQFFLYDGQIIEISRCMCSATLYSGKLACLNQDLYIDPQGRVNTCLEWEIQKNPYKTDLFTAITTRDSNLLTYQVNSLNIGKHACPVLLNFEQRESINAGLDFGTYHNK